MPNYDYECPDCGPFIENRPMAEFDVPQPCPDCGQLAPRLLAAPAMCCGPSDSPGNFAPPASHGGGCACCPARRMVAEAV